MICYGGIVSLVEVGNFKPAFVKFVVVERSLAVVFIVKAEVEPGVGGLCV